MDQLQQHEEEPEDAGEKQQDQQRDVHFNTPRFQSR